MPTANRANGCSIDGFHFAQKRRTVAGMKTIIIISRRVARFRGASRRRKMSRRRRRRWSRNPGVRVTGTVTFTKVGDEVQVVADIQNLKPGKHGFHIHEKGDCSAPDAIVSWRAF